MRVWARRRIGPPPPISLVQHFCLILFFLASLLIQAQEPNLQAIYAEAQSAESAGDLPTAVQRYRQIIRLRPDMAEAHANLGTLYYREGQGANAESDFRKAVSLKRELAGPFFYLGVISLEKGAPSEALRLLRKAGALEPSNGMTFGYIGYAEFAEHNNSGALDSLSHALALGAEDSNIFYILSEEADALSAERFSALQKRFPQSGFSELARAHVQEAKRNYKEAAALYAQALRKLPNQVALETKLAWITAKARNNDVQDSPNLDELADGALRYLYAPPAASDLKSSLGKALQSANKYGQAANTAEALYRSEDAYQSVSFVASLLLIDKYPDSFRSHQLRGKMLAEQSRIDEAIAEYRKALELQPDVPDLHFAIGNLEWQQGRLEEARKELETEMTSNPKDAYSLYELGDIAYREQRIGDAEVALKQSVKLNSSLKEAWLLLAKLQEQTRPEDSLADLKRAIAIDPNDPAPHYSLMALLKRQHRLAESSNELATYKRLKENANANAPTVSLSTN